MRMHVDSFVLKDIENRWLVFKEENLNLKFSLVADGVNPFGDMRSIYSMWPIFVINNNIPPWISIKDHIMLSMIVLCIFLFYSYLNLFINSA